MGTGYKNSKTHLNETSYKIMGELD